MRSSKQTTSLKSRSNLRQIEEDTASAQMMFKNLLKRADPDSQPATPDTKPKKTRSTLRK